MRVPGTPGALNNNDRNSYRTPNPPHFIDLITESSIRAFQTKRIFYDFVPSDDENNY